MDVAVKIIDPCIPATLPRVLKEAEVMMGLDHPNVVKAYQCSVWSRRQQEQIMKVRGQLLVCLLACTYYCLVDSSCTSSMTQDTYDHSSLCQAVVKFQNRLLRVDALPW